jgi:D-alanyl-D-alanine carboxypeptidase
MYEPARRLLMTAGLAVATLLATDFTAATASAQPRYVTTEGRYSAIVVDAASGEVLYEKNADAQRYPASITKVMTLYLTFEALSTGRLKLTDTIVVSPHAAAQAPSKLGLRAGESISVDEAMRALTVKSANDMAVAMAEKIGGSESRFAALMTLRAQELGMVNTHYVNANGLPDARQLSSAHDIAILWRAMMRDYPQYYSYFGLHSFDFRGETITSHIDLLFHGPGVDGAKTGYINASGFNIVFSATRDSRRLITVVLGGNSKAARDSHAEDLVDSGFNVLRRRQLGENITVAQNLFEPDPVGPITRPPVEQGSGDQAGLKIVLTNSEHGVAAPAGSRRSVETRIPGPHASANGDGDAPARVILAKADKPSSAAARIRESHAKTAGDWMIQVGAYKKKGQARTQLTALHHRYGEQLADAKGGVEAAGHGYYRARFAGLSAAGAKKACAELHAHRQTCAVVSPDA